MKCRLGLLILLVFLGIPQSYAAGASAEEKLECEKTLNIWMKYCGSGELQDDAYVWQKCVVGKMEMLGFRFLHDFVNDGAHNFRCFDER